SSCVLQKKLRYDEVIGSYDHNVVYGVGSNLSLKGDQTFEYNWVAGLTEGKTTGSWKMAGRKIILRSERQPSSDRKDTYDILAVEKKPTDSLTIKLLGSKNEKVAFANCMLKKGDAVISGVATNEQGSAKLPKLPEADSLIIQFVGYQTIRHKFDPAVSGYKFRMLDIPEYYVYFEDEVWTFKRRLLNDTQSLNDKKLQRIFVKKSKRK
ncbi:MAG: hypothetical protein AAF705_12015, partial [Bacteroidota bacterium]